MSSHPARGVMARGVLFHREVAKPEPTELLLELLELPVEARPKLLERLDAIGGLPGLANAGGEALDGLIDRATAKRLEQILALALELIAPHELPDAIDCASGVAAYFRPRLALRSSESFWVLMLDARGRPLGHVCIAEGTLTACLVHPREVFAPALRARAASIIVVHNHPSGDPEPSEEDEGLTLRLIDSGQLLGIPLLDHVIVARGGFRSIGGARAAETSDSEAPGACATRRPRRWKARSRRATMRE